MARRESKRPGTDDGPTGCDRSDGGSTDGPDTGCACRAAVIRAYDGMLGSGAPDSVALQAAIRVYRHYHPKAADDITIHTVETWVMRGPLH